MDKFKRIIEGGYSGFNTGARQIIRDSAEVSQYVESAHFTYVQQLMNDKIIDEAMGRVKGKRRFLFLIGRRHLVIVQIKYKQDKVLSEQYPHNPFIPSYRQQQTPQDNVAARLDAMERRK